MIVVYPYKKKDSDFCITNSVNLFRKHYPEAFIVTVGDSFGGEDQNIPFKDVYKVRGCNVTAKLLEAAKHFERFIFMNDDFFINDRFDLNRIYGSFEDLERKDKGSFEWNEAVVNTKAFLEHYNYNTTMSFECHQPALIESDKFIELFNQIEWKEIPHFIKSLYFNVYRPDFVKPIENTKMIKFNKKKADTYLTMYGCLSIGGDFLTISGVDYIKKLCS
jgi:hypothetical protein